MCNNGRGSVNTERIEVSNLISQRSMKDDATTSVENNSDIRIIQRALFLIVRLLCPLACRLALEMGIMKELKGHAHMCMTLYQRSVIDSQVCDKCVFC